MRVSSRILLALILAGLALGGCTESQRPTATGKGAIRAVHAMPSGPDVNFLIEERSLGTLAFRGATSTQQFDDLTYNFNFDVQLPGQSAVQRVATQSLAVVADMDYVFALTGTLDAPSVVLWETPEREFGGDETVFKASAGHLAADVGAVDVYLAPPGTAPAVGQERGTLSFGDRLEPFEAESGDYVFTVTGAGDPSDVLFTSNTQALAARSSALFTIQDADPSLTSAISVQRVGGDGAVTPLGDTRFPPTRRFFHAALGTAGVDVVVDDDFAAPVVSNLSFGTLSADTAVPGGSTDFTLTQAGNPGAILFEEEQTVPINNRSTAFITGPPGEIDVVTFTDNRRPVADLGKLRMTLLSENFEEVDLYLFEAGTDIADVSPNLPGFDSLLTSGYLQREANAYELTVTVAGEKTVAAGPFALDLANGDVIELAIIDTPDPNRLDIVAYDP